VETIIEKRGVSTAPDAIGLHLFREANSLATEFLRTRSFARSFVAS
jgi:hypothetical protein